MKKTTLKKCKPTKAEIKKQLNILAEYFPPTQEIFVTKYPEITARGRRVKNV